MDQIKRQRKEELSRFLDSQRHELAQGRERISQEFSLGHQLKRSVQQKPLTWFAGSLGTAAVASFLLRRPAAPEVRRKGFIRWSLGAAFGLAKPFLLKWALQQAQHQAVTLIENKPK